MIRRWIWKIILIAWVGGISVKKIMDDFDIKDKDILIVEDIVDTGLTLKYLIDYLRSYHPKTIKVCVFIDKHQRRETDIAIDYSCHDVAKGFLVGYGLDYNENYRYLSGIYHLKL